MMTFLSLVGVGLMGLLPLANPLTSVIVLLGIGGHLDETERNRQVRQASIYVFLILLVSFYAGQAILNLFAISLPGLRIAGGLIVGHIGFQMLFPKSPSDSGSQHAGSGDSIAFVPLAMPTTAGPGTIAFIISASATVPTHVSTWLFQSAAVTSFVLTGLICWLVLRAANPIMRLLGHSGIDAISRLMGFILACMGVQFVINGVEQVYHGLQG
ncbi:MarC family NAAT transporter [Frateuria aurantia]